jgi:hypothetical protein
VSVTTRCNTASRATSSSSPVARKPSPRSTCAAGRVGSVVTQPATRRSGSRRSIGLISEAAAAAVTAPVPARIQAAVRRSPRNAFQTAPAAARSSGVST